MGCCSILMPLLLSGCYMHSCWRNTQAALIIVDIENTRRKTNVPFRCSSPQLKGNFWDDQQVGGLVPGPRENSLAVGCSDRLGHAKNTNSGLTSL